VSWQLHRQARFAVIGPLTTPWGFPCCVRFPCVHAVATTPAQRPGVTVRSFIPAVSAFPERVVGSACASSFSRLARRSLALRPAHSRCHRISRHAIRRLQLFRHLHSCSDCFRLERLPGGTRTHWKAPPCHGAHPKRSLGECDRMRHRCPLTGLMLNAGPTAQRRAPRHISNAG
jgi:hypothetical protein